MKRYYLILSIILVLSFLPYSGYAAWLENVPRQVTQPDGQIIDVLVTGDEFHRWGHIENFTIIQDSETGFWCWATVVDGNLGSTGYPVHLYTPESLNLSPKVNISTEIYRQKRARFTRQMRTGQRNRSIGEINNIVVFIRFAGETEFEQSTSYWYNKFNALGEDVNSLSQYFYDASYQQLDLYSLIFPLPTAENIVSYQSVHPRSYLQPYNAVTNPNGYVEEDEGFLRAQQMLADAINFIQYQVPPEMVTDTIDEGFVDNICFIIRGESGDWGDVLWPHMWELFLVESYLHGKRAWTYNFNIEDYTGDEHTSTIMHEFGHSLGAPDFYRYEVAGIPIAIWDIMSNNFEPAQSMSAFTKYLYMGWTEDIPEITESGTYTLYPITVSKDNHAYFIASPYSEDEGFIVEYRNNETGLTDSVLPGSGLVVYRVFPSANEGNAMGPPDQLYVYREDGTPESDGIWQNAYFSVESGRTAINDNTNPYSFLSDGLPGGLDISNISSAGETISFYVTIREVSDKDINKPIFQAELMQNYPNPFNPETTINFSLNRRNHVSINIFNIRGQKVKTLVNDTFDSGEHSVIWNGTNDDGQNVSSGIYLYQMKSNGSSMVKRMLLMK